MITKLDKIMVLLLIGTILASSYQEEIKKNVISPIASVIAKIEYELGASARAEARAEREAKEAREAAIKAEEEKAARDAEAVKQWRKENGKKAIAEASEAAAALGLAALWLMSDDPCDAAKKACQCLQDTSCDDVDAKKGMAACVYFKANCQ